MEKRIITVAQTVGLHGKDGNPVLTEQPDEIIKSAYDFTMPAFRLFAFTRARKTGRYRSIMRFLK
jgi:hypothetical protein